MKSSSVTHPSRIHPGSLVQLIGAGLAIAGLWSAGAFLALVGLLQGFWQKNIPAGQSMLMAGVASFLAGCLCLPSIYYPLCRLLTWKPVDLLGIFRRLRPSLLIFLFPIVLALGYGLVRLGGVSWIFLPPIHVLAVALPVLWLVYIALRNITPGSPQRLWGAFDSGLVLGPALILVAELVVLILFAFLAAFYISSQPDLLAHLLVLSERFYGSTSSPEELVQLLSPFLLRPEVLLAALAFAGVFVPLVEEILKPVGVWLLAWRRLEPAQGFVVGALSGAGYALFESLLLPGSGEGWLGIVIGRAGTAVLHITTSALMGWSLVRAWKQSRYLQLALAYLGVAFFHGLWNTLAVLTAFATLSNEIQGSFIDPAVGETIVKFAPAGLVTIVLVIFSVLVWLNLRLASPTSSSLPAADMPASVPLAQNENGGQTGAEPELNE